MADGIEILQSGTLPPATAEELRRRFRVHQLSAMDELPALTPALAGVRGIARGFRLPVARPLFDSLPNLEIVANFGVGYDGIDLALAAGRGIVVTNTPDVLTEEVADTALGLLLMTVRELGAADAFVRAGRWPGEPNFRLTASLRNRTVGIAGLGRIGLAIARRLDAMQVPVAYHSRTRRPDVAYPYHADLLSLARDVDTLIVVLPGTPEARNAIDAAVLKALGPEGILVNVGRGSVVDEPALIAALRDGTIRAAGLDVYASEPNVPKELIALPNTVLLPHVGSGTVPTRDAMGRLMIDNLTRWFKDGAPLTPVPETPVPPRRRA